MATITDPSTALPVSGDDMNAEQVKDWVDAIINFIEATNIDEANVDLSGSDGITGKSTAQTLTGLKSLENTGAAAAGIMSALEVGVNPASGTVTAGDGPRLVMYGDDSGGTKTTLVELRAPWVTPTDGATEAANFEVHFRNANAIIEGVTIGADGFIFNETGADLDYRAETDTNANGFTINAGIFTGVGAIGLAAAATDAAVVLIDNPALTATASTNIAKLRIENTAAITVPAGTTAIAASVSIDEPNLTATGTITSAVTLYIEAAPTEGGTNNYALWVDSGTSAFGGNLVPDANDGAALGTTTVGFSDLFLATGGVINWANGEVTITETDSNTLTIAGVATRVDLAAGILELNNAVEWDTGVAVVAAEYSIGRDADGTNQLHFNVPTGATFEWSVNDVSGMVLTGGPILLINDTANTNMTIGLTLNQGANDNEILSFKSSDVAHGMTDLSETDTYGFIRKQAGDTGGLNIRGYHEGTPALYLEGFGTIDDTTKSTAGAGYVVLRGAIKSVATVGDAGANANLVAVLNNGTARFILDADGDSHQDVGTAWTNFDSFEDIVLMDALAIAVAREEDSLRMKFVGQLEENRAILEALPGKPVVSFNKDGHHFVNMSRLSMLHHGALRQAYRRIEHLESQLKLLCERN